MMNNNTATKNSTEPTSISVLGILGALVNLSAGTLGIVCNIIMIVMLLSQKAFRKPCFQLIAGASIGSLVMAVYNINSGASKLRLALGYSVLETSGLLCMFYLGVPSVFGLPFNAQMTWLVACDRLLSLMAPARYRTFGKRYAVFMLCCSASLVLTQVIIGFAVSPLSEIVKCTQLIDAANRTFVSVYAAIDFYFSTAQAVTYAVVLICYLYKRRKAQQGTTEYDLFMKRQAILMPIVKMLMLFYSISGILPAIFANTSVNIDRNSWISLVLIAIVGYLKAGAVFVEFISLTVSCREFRNCLKRMVPWKPNAVSQNG